MLVSCDGPGCFPDSSVVGAEVEGLCTGYAELIKLNTWTPGNSHPYADPDVVAVAIPVLGSANTRHVIELKPSSIHHRSDIRCPVAKQLTEAPELISQRRAASVNVRVIWSSCQRLAYLTQLCMFKHRSDLEKSACK